MFTIWELSLVDPGAREGDAIEAMGLSDSIPLMLSLGPNIAARSEGLFASFGFTDQTPIAFSGSDDALSAYELMI